MAQLYRKALLERMSSPEQLDKMLKVTSPMFWVALLGGGLMIAAALAWAILGSLPIKVEAGGVYVPHQGTYSVSTFTAGTVRQIYVEIGDMVEQGQTVLTLAGDGIANAETTEARINKVEAVTLVSTDDEVTADNVDLIQIKAQLAIDNLDAQQQESLKVQFEIRKAAILSSLRMQLEQHIATLIDYMAVAPVSGIVTDIKVNLGSAVGQGSEVVKIRQIDDENEDIIQCYLPISQGKKIHAGMKVIVYPTTVNKQEYGHMEAEVVSVDQYVSTASSILNSLGDESLAASFTQSGPVVGVTCRLKKDESTASGYWWSNTRGASITLEYGTPVMVDIITEEKAPITMILPFIEETFSLSGGGAQ